MTEFSPPPPIPEAPGYPMSFEVAYPDRLSRWKTLLRGPLILPAYLFAYLLSFMLYAALPAGWVAVFLRKRYPSWLFAGVAGAAAFHARFWSYGALLTDRYPAFNDEGPVRLEYQQPEPGSLSRWRVLFYKSVLLLPQAIVVGFLQVALFAVTIIAWFAILFTGNYPRGIFAFSTGVIRWQFRIFAYFASFTDAYPPYSLSEKAGPGSNASTVTNGVIGLLLTGALVAAIVAAVALGNRYQSEDVDYAALQQGRADTTPYFYGRGFRAEAFIQLTRAYDPADDMVAVLEIGRRERVVIFEWQIENIDIGSLSLSADARLDIRLGATESRHRPVLMTLGDRALPGKLSRGSGTVIRAVFVIPLDAIPTELRYDPGPLRLERYRYRFE